MYSIYAIQNTVNNKYYIGLTCEPKKRRQQHLCDLRRGDHFNVRLQKSFNKHGEQAFSFRVITKGILTREDANEWEQWWISELDTVAKGYNITLGGKTVDAQLGRISVWNGIYYRSVKAAARANGISSSGMHHRLKAGYSCDGNLPAQNEWSSIETTWNGITYPSIREAAKANDISEISMYDRLRKGYVCDGDMLGAAGANSNPTTWNGVEYSSVRQAAAANGINRHQMGRYIAKGYTCDDDVKRGKEQ